MNLADWNIYSLHFSCSRDIEAVNGFPFEINRPSANPYEALTEHEILDKLKKSREHAAQGMYKDATEVSRDMRAKYGL